MFELMPGTSWLLFAYAVGTGFGYVLGKTSSIKNAAEVTIDSLIEKGYLKTRRGANGELEILKYNEE
jgi:hypothetical protein